MKKECSFYEAIIEYQKGVEIESCLTKTKYKIDLETSKHIKKRNVDEDFYPSGDIQINEINATWIINK